MDTLIEILEELEPGVDYENCTTLIDDHILSSLTIISLVAEIEDEFDVAIPAVKIIPENFNSAAALWDLIRELMDEE